MVFITIHNPDIADSTTAGSTSKMDEDGKTTVDGEKEQQERTKVPSMTFAKIAIKERDCLPLRMSAFHLCTPDTPFYVILESFTAAMLKGDRCRIKVHHGTWMSELLR